MHQKAMPTARHVMERDHFSLSGSSSLTQAARALSDTGLPMVPVCHSNGRLVGVVTAAAVLDAVAGGTTSCERRVEDVMDTNPVVVAEYATVEWILVEMNEAHLWSLPVVDLNEHLVGVVTLRHLVSLVSDGVLIRIWNRVTG